MGAATNLKIILSDMNDNTLQLFFLGLEQNFIPLAEVREMADDIIMKNDPVDCSFYLFDISLSHNRHEILEILDLEIERRKLNVKLIPSDIVLNRVAKMPIDSDEKLFGIIRLLFHLTHELQFTEKELNSIYLVDEYLDEYFNNYVSIELLRKELSNFLNKY